jgi:peptide/nickel transport system substrate-binding protein
LICLALVACAGASPTPATAPAAPTTAPRGELRIATALSIPAAMNTWVGQTGYNFVTYGAGEMLMRLTPELKLEPWLAEAAKPVNATTWQVTLRKSVAFHDGSPLTAETVAASLRQSLTQLAGAKNFIDPDVKLEAVDAHTLNISTPQPQGNLLYALANWNFVIAKPPVDGISVLTGAFRPVKLEKDQEFVLEANDRYWQGAPQLKRVIVKRIPDATARALALQSGDIDVLTNVAPDAAAGMPTDITRDVVAGTRMHFTILNVTRPPFDDPRVRQAVNSAINRELLLKAALNGDGAVAENLYPASTGIPLVRSWQQDTARAAQLLDEAGWLQRGSETRSKAGTPLSFVLHSYPGRPEITQMALVMQAQLKPLGIEVKVEEVKDIVEQIKDGKFQASMFSIGVQADPQYAPGVSLKAARSTMAATAARPSRPCLASSGASRIRPSGWRWAGRFKRWSRPTRRTCIWWCRR